MVQSNPHVNGRGSQAVNEGDCTVARGASAYERDEPRTGSLNRGWEIMVREAEMNQERSKATREFLEKEKVKCHKEVKHDDAMKEFIGITKWELIGVKCQSGC